MVKWKGKVQHKYQDLIIWIIVPIIPEFLYYIRHRHDPVIDSSAVTSEVDADSIYATTTMTSTVDILGVNVSNLCFAGSSRNPLEN